MARQKAATMSLVSMAKSSTKKILALLKASKEPKVKTPPGRKSAAPVVETVWEVAPDLGSAVPVLHASAWKAHTHGNSRTPLSVKLAADDLLATSTVIADACSSFDAKFSKSPARAQDGRAQRALKSEAGDLILQRISLFIPGDLIVNTANLQCQMLTAALIPSTFGIAKNHATATAI